MACFGHVGGVCAPTLNLKSRGNYLSFVFKFCLVAASPSIIRFFMLQKSCGHQFEVVGFLVNLHGFIEMSLVVSPLSMHHSHGFYGSQNGGFLN